MKRRLAPLLAVAAIAVSPAALAVPEPPLAAVTPVGPPQVVFSAKRDACDGDDVPDAPPRAFRDRSGGVVMFGLHTKNRALRGPDLDHLKIDCRPTLESHGAEDPAAYDDASWITATWSDDGQSVAALVHHEYQANTHPGRCPKGEYLACWYNSIVAVSSKDEGRSFERPSPPVVVASAPFRQEIEQGRHRGFFNPSNIVKDGNAYYTFMATTGWTGQEGGACLFRTTTPFDPASWRAYDGHAFSRRSGDPYRGGAGAAPCRVVPPFPAPVGSVARHRATGTWLAVFQASADGRAFPEPGLYATSSRDLMTWDTPRLVLAGRTLYDDPCGSGGRLLAYPTLIDPAAAGRNFDDVGDTADLYYVTLRVEGCRITSDRDLVRRRVAIKVWP